MTRRFLLYAGPAIFLAFLAGLPGCRMLTSGYAGRDADPKGLIRLAPGGPHKDLWQARDLYVAYSYRLDRPTLALSGAAEFGGMLGRNFSSIESFHLQVHFVDAAGKILQSRGLAAAGRFQDIKSIPFNRVLELPEGAAAMIFSYAGRVVEGGGHRPGKDDDGVSFDFWQTPLK